MANALSDLYRSARKVLVLIGLSHIGFVIVTLWVLFQLNMREQGNFTPPAKSVMIMAALLGFLGSLLYFSRKIYVYLITDKFFEMMRIQDDISNEDIKIDRFKSMLFGYYIYLSTRPIAGLVIGPLLYMAVLAGLTTFSKAPTGPEVSLSTAGVYLIYVISFIGGYSSSDLFDYFSGLGAKLIKNITLK